jgi:tetratricopeptide (TPR) repeat protein
VLLGTPLVYDLWWLRGARTRLDELCGAYGRAFGAPDPSEAPACVVFRWHGTALRGLDQRLSSVDIHGHCRRAAAARGDQVEECRALVELCTGYRQLARLDDSRSAGLAALRLAEGLELVHERADVLLRLAKLERVAGRREVSAEYAEAGRSEAEALGRDDLASKAHDALGVLLRVSDPAEAERHLRRGLDLARRAGARVCEANLLGRLGDLFLQFHRWDEASDYLSQALTLRLMLGHRSVLDRANLGLVRLALGERGEALEHIQVALELALCRELRRELATVLGQLGEAFAQPGTFLLSAACSQTALYLYAAWGMNTDRRERFMGHLREMVEAAGEDWARLESDARERRDDLLAEATGVPADRWRDNLQRMARGADVAGEEVSP